MTARVSRVRLTIPIRKSASHRKQLGPVHGAGEVKQGIAERQEHAVAFDGQHFARALLHWGTSPFVLRARTLKLVRHGGGAISYRRPPE